LLDRDNLEVGAEDADGLEVAQVARAPLLRPGHKARVQLVRYDVVDAGAGKGPLGSAPVLLAEPLGLDGPAQPLAVEERGDLVLRVKLVQVANPADQGRLVGVDREVAHGPLAWALGGEEDRVVPDRDQRREPLALPGRLLHAGGRLSDEVALVPLGPQELEVGQVVVGVGLEVVGALRGDDHAAVRAAGLANPAAVDAVLVAAEAIEVLHDDRADPALLDAPEDGEHHGAVQEVLAALDLLTELVGPAALLGEPDQAGGVVAAVVVGLVGCAGPIVDDRDPVVVGHRCASPRLRSSS
jgi:hypothetical protein